MSLFLRKTGLIFLGLLIAFVLLVMAFWKLDWAQFWAVLVHIQIFPWIPLAGISYLFGHVARGVRLHYLVSKQANLPLFTATNIVVFGYAMNNILPLRLGEVARIGMLNERTGLPVTQCATVTILERVFDGLTILALLLFSTFILGETHSLARETMNVVGLILFLGFSFIACATFFPGQITLLALQLTKKFSANTQKVCLEIASQIINGVAYLTSFRNTLRIVSWSIFIWFLESLTYLFMFPCFGIEINPLHALFLMSIVNLAILIPSTPGYIGPFHYFTMQTLMSFGISSSVALSFAFVVHMVIYIPLTLWGLGILYWYGIQLKETLTIVEKSYQATQGEEVSGIAVRLLAHFEPQKNEVGIHPFLKIIIETILEEEMKKISAEQKGIILNSITKDFMQQIAELSPFHRLLFFVGLSAFRLYVLVSYLHSFKSLSIEQRIQAINNWAYGRLSVTRKFFRLIRSFVFVMFYDRAPSTSVKIKGEAYAAR